MVILDIIHPKIIPVRTKNTRIFMLMLPALLLLWGCKNNPITESENGNMVEFAIGSEFSVQLKGQPDKGYIWKVTGVHDDVLKQVGEPDILTAGQTGKGYGTYTFTFETVNAGTTLLRLIYFNKNMEDPVPEKTFELKVISGTIGRIES